MTFAKKIEDYEYKNPYHLCFVVDERKGKGKVSVRYSPFPEFHGEVWRGDDTVHALLKGVSSVIGCSTTTMTVKLWYDTENDCTIAVIGGDTVKDWMEPVSETKAPFDPEQYLLVNVEKVGEVVWKVLDCDDIPGCVGAELTSPFQQNAVITMVANALGCEEDDITCQLLNSNWEKGLHSVQVWGDPITAYLSVVPRTLSGGVGTVMKDEVKEAWDRLKEPKTLTDTDGTVFDTETLETVKPTTSMFPPKALLATSPDPKEDNYTIGVAMEDIDCGMVVTVTDGGGVRRAEGLHDNAQWVHKNADDPDDVPAVAPPFEGPSKDNWPEAAKVQQEYVTGAQKRRQEKFAEQRQQWMDDAADKREAERTPLAKKIAHGAAYSMGVPKIDAKAAWDRACERSMASPEPEPLHEPTKKEHLAAIVDRLDYIIKLLQKGLPS